MVPILAAVRVLPLNPAGRGLDRTGVQISVLRILKPNLTYLSEYNITFM